MDKIKKIDEKPPFLSVGKFAKTVGLPRAYISSLARQGRIPCVKPSNRNLYINVELARDILDDLSMASANDTLWHIAQRYSNDEHDIREIVYNIAKDNNVQNGTIHAGQKLFIKKELLNVPASSNSQHR